jgi:hypothetical protein
MKPTIYWGDFRILPVYMEKEVNFTVLNSQGYCCMLVPICEGFELSEMDRALGNDPGDNFVYQIGSYIISYFL